VGHLAGHPRKVPADAARLRLGSFQDWLVVTGEGKDELDEDESDEDEPDDEVVVDGDDVVDVVEPPKALVVLFASAGSWPDTNCVAITPHTARNVVSVTAVMRRRMRRIRRRRPSTRARPSSRGVSFWVSVGVVMSNRFDADPWHGLRTG
jgi:hypothetical protein